MVVMRFFASTSLGAWGTFMGLFPDYVFKIVKEDLLQVEGLVRAFDGEVPRTEEALLEEIKRIFMVKGITSKVNIDKTLAELIDNSISIKGNSLLRQAQGKGKGAWGRRRWR